MVSSVENAEADKKINQTAGQKRLTAWRLAISTDLVRTAWIATTRVVAGRRCGETLLVQSSTDQRRERMLHKQTIIETPTLESWTEQVSDMVQQLIGTCNE